MELSTDDVTAASLQQQRQQHDQYGPQTHTICCFAAEMCQAAELMKFIETHSETYAF